MNGKRPKNGQWIQLARGIPLAGILLLSACSSDAPRNIPEASSANAGVNTRATVSPLSVTDLTISPDSHGSTGSPAATNTEVNTVSTVRNIYFSDNDATLSEGSRRIIRQHVEYLNQNPKQKPKRLIVLRAYLDRRGSRTFSLAMAQKRLDVVMEALLKYGVPKSRVRQVMLGRRGKTLACEHPSCQNSGQRIELRYK